VIVPFVSLDVLAALSETAPFPDAFTSKDLDHQTLSTDIFSTVARSDKRDLYVGNSMYWVTFSQRNSLTVARLQDY
jgi:hypothetical protein